MKKIIYLLASVYLAISCNNADQTKKLGAPLNRLIRVAQPSTGSLYKPKFNAIPGDSILLENLTLSNVYIDSAVNGWPDKKVRIFYKGIVRVGGKGFTRYSWVMYRCRNWTLEPWQGDTVHNKLIIGGTATETPVTGLSLDSSYGCTIKNVNFQYCTIAIQSNKQYLVNQDNIQILNNNFLNILHEGIYLGITNNYTPLGRFTNCLISGNTFKNIGWDAIQGGHGDYTITNNLIYGYGQQDSATQRTGIIIGNNATAKISGNLISGGKGTVYQNFGTGQHTFKNNRIENVTLYSLHPLEDLVYINARGTGFALDFSGNTFTNCSAGKSAKMVKNLTTQDKTTGSTFAQNKGLVQGACTLGIKDKFYPYTATVDTVPVPVKTIKQKLILYTDSTYSVE